MAWPWYSIQYGDINIDIGQWADPKNMEISFLVTGQDLIWSLSAIIISGDSASDYRNFRNPIFCRNDMGSGD